jgi:hypothetical protein
VGKRKRKNFAPSSQRGKGAKEEKNEIKGIKGYSKKSSNI